MEVADGQNCRIRIAPIVAGAPIPQAVYGAPQYTGGLRKITAINNEPTPLIFVPTGTQQSFAQQKQQDTEYFFWGDPNGELFEKLTGAQGTLNVTVVHEFGFYQRSLDLLIAASEEANKFIYYRMDTILIDPATPNITGWHTRAAVIGVSQQIQQAAQETRQSTTFNLRSTGSIISGYTTS